MRLDQDDDDPPFLKHVNCRVTIDMVSTEDLVQELVDRERLRVITVRRKVPRENYLKPGFLSAINAILACDISKMIVSQEFMVESTTQTKNNLEFSAVAVVLTPLEGKQPI